MNKYIPLHIIFLLFFALLLSLPIFGQNYFPEKTTVTDTNNIFNPLLSTVVIPQKQSEIIFFNFLSSRQLETTRIIGSDTSIENSRQSSFLHIVQFNYGLSEKWRLNMGADIFYAHVRSDSDSESSYWRVLGNQKSTGESTHGVQAIGPRLRWSPFKYVPELMLQSAVHFSVSNDLLKKRKLGLERTRWQHQVTFYQHLFRHTWQLQADASILLENENRRQTTYSFSISSYHVFEIRPEQLFAFGSIIYSTNREKSRLGGLRQISYNLLGGVGLFWQIKPARWSMNAQYTFPISHDIGSLITEVEPGTWWNFSVGARYAF